MLLKNDASNRILRYPPQRLCASAEAILSVRYLRLRVGFSRDTCPLRPKSRRRSADFILNVNGTWEMSLFRQTVDMHFFLYFCACLPAVSDLPVIFAMLRQTCFPSRELIQQLSYLPAADCWLLLKMIFT